MQKTTNATMASPEKRYLEEICSKYSILMLRNQAVSTCLRAFIFVLIFQLSRKKESLS